MIENRINERTLFSQTQHPPDLKRCSVLGTGTYPRYKGLLTNLLYPKTTKEICHLAKYLLYLLLKITPEPNAHQTRRWTQ